MRLQVGCSMGGIGRHDGPLHAREPIRWASRVKVGMSCWLLLRIIVHPGKSRIDDQKARSQSSSTSGDLDYEDEDENEDEDSASRRTA
jgi:hypothetical protein